jgi:hypothetical protein
MVTSEYKTGSVIYDSRMVRYLAISTTVMVVLLVLFIFFPYIIPHGPGISPDKEFKSTMTIVPVILILFVYYIVTNITKYDKIELEGENLVFSNPLKKKMTEKLSGLDSITRGRDGYSLSIGGSIIHIFSTLSISKFEKYVKILADLRRKSAKDQGLKIRYFSKLPRYEADL